MDTFSDLSSVMTTFQIKTLKSVYGYVDDIDLFVGGLMEKKIHGGLLGPTFTCIIADQVSRSIILYRDLILISTQMFRTMFGDRFFYSFTNSSNPFTQGK